MQVRGGSFDGYLQLLEQYGIPLYDDGDRTNHGDERAGDGIYSNKWKVPVINSRYAVNGGVDFYVDIVPIDNAGNYPREVCVTAWYSSVFFYNEEVPLPLPPGSRDSALILGSFLRWSLVTIISRLYKQIFYDD